MLVIFGVVPVVAAFFVALSFLGREEFEAEQPEVQPLVEEEAPPPETRSVLASARALPIGTLLAEEDLALLTLELPEIESTYLIESDDLGARSLRGYAVREALPAGMPLTRSAVVGPGQRGFLAAVLRPGTRAVTVRVGPATSQAGLIDPGDRVDVILSAELRIDEREPEVFARTIVEDVRVVAVDHRVNGEEPEDPEVATATLEVAPADGDRLVLAEHEGRLSLAVRALAVAAPPPPSKAVALYEVLLEDGAPDPDAGAMRDLEDRLRAEIAASEELLWAEMEDVRAAVEEDQAAVQSAEPPVYTVRIYRGGLPPEPVEFKR